MSTFFIENRQGRHEHTFYRGARKTYRKTLPNGDPLPFEGKPICAYTVESETTIFKFWIWPETDQDFKLHPDDVAEIHPQYVRFRTGRVFRGRGEYVLCDPGEGVEATEKLSRILLTQRPAKTASTERTRKARSDAGKRGRAIADDGDRALIKKALLMLVSNSDRGQSLSKHAAAKRVQEWVEKGVVEGVELTQTYYGVGLDTIKRIVWKR